MGESRSSGQASEEVHRADKPSVLATHTAAHVRQAAVTSTQTPSAPRPVAQCKSPKSPSCKHGAAQPATTYPAVLLLCLWRCLLDIHDWLLRGRHHHRTALEVVSALLQRRLSIGCTPIVSVSLALMWQERQEGKPYASCSLGSTALAGCCCPTRCRRPRARRQTREGDPAGTGAAAAGAADNFGLGTA